jgi:hypothetical protein
MTHRNAHRPASVPAPIRLALFSLLALLPLFSAQGQETIGFEFEDYQHAWPAAYPPHTAHVYYRSGSGDAPPVRVRYDDRLGYRDLEVHVGPFPLDDVPEDAFANYQALYRELGTAADTAQEATLAGWYRYKPVKTFILEQERYPLVLVTAFVHNGIANKTRPGNPPQSDVGPQATFSLGTAKVYGYFRDSPRNPFVYPRTLGVVTRMDAIDESRGTVADCQRAPERSRTVYGCSVRARGFAYFLAVYLNDTVVKLNALGRSSGEIKKETYPLYLRSIGGRSNAVKEYYRTLIEHDPILAGDRSGFIADLKAILPRALVSLSPDIGIDTSELVAAYLDFLNGPDDSGFEFGPTGEFGVRRYTFSTLSEPSDAVITDPRADSVYFEIRNLRNQFVRELGQEPAGYAVSYDTAVGFARRALDYLADFDHRWQQAQQ